MNLSLYIWRQKNRDDKGRLVQYEATDVSPDMSLLKMLDMVNEGLIRKGEDAVSFDSDCREGICGMCGQVIDGEAHGPRKRTTACQLHMRNFKDDDSIYIEPFRARAFPVVKDLIVDRSALDKIIQSGGYISVQTGGMPDGNAILMPFKSGRRKARPLFTLDSGSAPCPGADSTGVRSVLKSIFQFCQTLDGPCQSCRHVHGHRLHATT